MTPRRPARPAGPGVVSPRPGPASPGPRTEDAFDRALGAAARSLAAEALPRGVLEAPLAPRGNVRSGSGRFAFAVVAVMLLAAGGAILGGLLRPTVPGRGAVLNPTVVVVNQLRGSGWTCSPGPGSSPSAAAGASAASPRTSPATPTLRASTVPSGAAARPSAEVCLAPPTLHPLVAALIVDESTVGVPVGIHIKADVLGVSNGTLETRQIDLLYEVVALPFADPADAAAARAWVRGHLPSTAAPEPTTIAGVPLRLEVLSGGGYGVLIGTAAVATP